MLVDKDDLREALGNFEKRNIFIKCLEKNILAEYEEYTKVKSRSTYIYKSILIFWLGSYFGHEPEILADKEVISPYPLFKFNLYRIYFCFLILDKYISSLNTETEPEMSLQLKRIQLMNFYNENYLRLSSPDFFDDFKLLISELDPEQQKGVENYALVSKVKKILLQECNQVFSPGEEAKPGPLTMNTPFEENFGSNFCPSNIRARILMAIIGKKHRYPFCYQNVLLSLEQTVRRIFIPAKDGVLLDGLLFKKNKSKTVVLVQIWPYQAENKFFSQNYSAYQEFFDTSIVFINHRNHATRSNKVATSLAEVAKDVLEFAHYFIHKGKKIVLYGLCGGASFMILAAQQLVLEELPFKLIVDRFSQQYTNFFEYKTIKRCIFSTPLAISDQQRSFRFFFITPHIFIAIGLLRLFLAFAKVNINFAAILRDIPEEDVLVLQAQDKKQATPPQFTDLIIRPENSIRAALKDQRQNKKKILQSFVKYCERAAGSCKSFSNEISVPLKELKTSFLEALELIDNEKLTGTGSCSVKNIDIHTRELYLLTTRHKLPISQFILGFFNRPDKKFSLKMGPDLLFTAQEIYERLERYHGHRAHNLEHYRTFSNYLSLILNMLNEHKVFISYTSNRLASTKKKSLELPLEAILNYVIKLNGSVQLEYDKH